VDLVRVRLESEQCEPDSPFDVSVANEHPEEQAVLLNRLLQ
jgi:hypothetical protein